MKYLSSLLRWIFSEKHPLENAEYAPGAFERLLMNAAQAKGQIRRRRFVNILFWRHIIKTAVFAVIELLGEEDILDDKSPPPDKIYGELIRKFGYIDGVSL